MYVSLNITLVGIMALVLIESFGIAVALALVISLIVSVGLCLSCKVSFAQPLTLKKLDLKMTLVLKVKKLVLK